MLTRFAPLALLLAAASGCNEPLDGFEWDVTAVGAVDLCNPEPVGYQESFTYRLTFEGANVNLAIGPDAFAKGSIAGCRIAYSSVVWGEEKNGHMYRWVLEGEAVYRQGSGCDAQLPNNVDWLGTETFTILETSDDDIPPDCTYQLDVEGVYVGPADR